MTNVLTVFAVAKNNSKLTEDVYSAGAVKNTVCVKLVDEQAGKALVEKHVTGLNSALKVLEDYNVTDCFVSYNTDVTKAISKLTEKISKHYVKA